MCKEFEIVPDDIEKVLLAGAFGSSLNPVSSAAIGLIPPELSKRIIPVGNAAGEGAVIAAKNYDELKRYENIAENVKFLELGGKTEFQETFIENLSF